MNTENTYVRARIDSDTKMRAVDALEGMGLSVSDAIRLLMLRIAEEKRIPFEVRIPNKVTQSAIHELETGRGNRLKSVQALMNELHEND